VRIYVHDAGDMSPHAGKRPVALDDRDGPVERIDAATYGDRREATLAGKSRVGIGTTPDAFDTHA
jgi:hypothetical protein